MTTLASDNATRAYRRPRPNPSRLVRAPRASSLTHPLPPVPPRLLRLTRVLTALHDTRHQPAFSGPYFRPSTGPKTRPTVISAADVHHRTKRPSFASSSSGMEKGFFSKEVFFFEREKERERIWCFEKEEELFLSGEFLSGLGLIDLGREGEVCVIGRGEEGI